MANKSIFRSKRQNAKHPPTVVRNLAGGIAYRRSDEQALAQFAVTGCLNGTFYASPQDQLTSILGLCEKVDGEMIAKTAIYCRDKAHMKDLPALLVAVLSVKQPELLPKVFPKVINSGKMLRNFVQIMRSGVVGRQSLGTRPKRLVREWLDNTSDHGLFRASVGASPSMADVIKMVHPKPQTETRRALYGYLLGREQDAEKLPELVRQYEKFKAQPKNHEVPNLPFQFIAGLDIGKKQWKGIARHGSWQMTRMNLNTFLRHGVFEDRNLVTQLAARLRDPVQIRKARVLPYQLMVTWMHASDQLPKQIRQALHDAMEVSLSNVPEVPGKVYVLPDISGSMHWSVTGYRKGATSKIKCVQVAGLITAAMLRRNPQTEVVPFSDRVVQANLKRKGTVMGNAKKLASLPSGGTNCSAPLSWLNQKKAKGDLVIFVSDNESWIDSRRRHLGQSTQTMKEWNVFKQRNPKAQLICIDLTPQATVQAKEIQDVYNIGGFSDKVFELIGQIAYGRASADHWVEQIRKVEI